MKRTLRSRSYWAWMLFSLPVCFGIGYTYVSADPSVPKDIAEALITGDLYLWAGFAISASIASGLIRLNKWEAAENLALDTRHNYLALSVLVARIIPVLFVELCLFLLLFVLLDYNNGAFSSGGKGLLGSWYGPLALLFQDVVGRVYIYLVMVTFSWISCVKVRKERPILIAAVLIPVFTIAIFFGMSRIT